jgi:spermidine synthase
MLQRVQIVDDAGRAVLVVEGTIQSVGPADVGTWGSYWSAMVPPFGPRKALILGLGGASLAHLLVRRWGATARIIGVDDDLDVIRIATDAGWLEVPGLEVRCAGAEDFIRRCRKRFDYVAVDMYRGAEAPAFSRSPTFLRRIAAVLEGPGWLAMNVYRGAEPAELSQWFTIEHQLHVADNRVIHAKRRQTFGSDLNDSRRPRGRQTPHDRATARRIDRDVARLTHR